MFEIVYNYIPIIIDNRKENDFAFIDVTTAGGTDSAVISSSSHIFGRLKEFCSNESILF